MYFEIEDSHPETPSLESAISTREGVLLSLVFHALLVMAIIYLPQMPLVRQAMARVEAERVRQVELQRQRQRDAERRFVFVQPRVDLQAPQPPPAPELSDKNRIARAIERALRPANPLPFARGNSSERVEADKPASEPPRGATPTPPAAGASGEGDSAERRDAVAPPLEQAPRGLAYNNRPPPGSGGGLRVPSALGEALRNIERYVPESFNNPQGGVSDFGSTIQFDTRGVEFGPWIRRFVAQVKRNWFIPYAAMSMKGHVVLTFFVHRDGTISDLTVLKPSSVDAFTNAAFNALASSNPTQPLPPEYPTDRAFFTVTFYYNESPSQESARDGR